MNNQAVDLETDKNAGVFSAFFAKIFDFGQKHPIIAAILLGLVAACGYPPLHMWFVALPALALLVAHIYSAPNGRAALFRGYAFGWAHLSLANNWIATAFTYQTKMPEFLGWAAVPLLCLYLAIYPALAALAAHLLARRLPALAFGAVFAGAWIITEWLRSWVFTGYPWPPLGLMLLGGWNAAGVAEFLPVLGTYALSGVAVLIASLMAALLHQRRWIITSIFCALVSLQMVFPEIRVTPAMPSEDDIAYTLVQPLIPQDEINDDSKFEEQFQRIAGLTFPGRDRSRVVFWPESSIPDLIEDGYPQRYYDLMTVRNPATGYGDPRYARQRIAQVIGPKSTLLAGVVNLDIGQREDGTIGAVTARNSVLGLNGAGEITHHYAKEHLVPYGEYLPMPWLLEPMGLSQLVQGGIPYDPGPGPQTLDLGEHGRAGIQICYEIIFSGQVVDRDNRPDYLFNPSNDGWFGAWGPPQFLAQARLRAIEEGLPVLRSTTTGISAVIDAKGLVLQSIPRNEAGMVEGYIPPAHPPTLFARLGNALPLAWAVMLLMLGLGLPRLLALRASRS